MLLLIRKAKMKPYQVEAGKKFIYEGMTFLVIKTATGKDKLFVNTMNWRLTYMDSDAQVQAIK